MNMYMLKALYRFLDRQCIGSAKVQAKHDMPGVITHMLHVWTIPPTFAQHKSPSCVGKHIIHGGYGLYYPY